MEEGQAQGQAPLPPQIQHQHPHPPPPSHQQQPLQQQQPAVAGIAPIQNAENQFACQWLGCNERSPNAEVLYDHVCENHIGRKSTNNLNLQCSWGSCRVTVVKRDHITSHIRVHVPLKPHRCEFCGKAFKRPQDLKKHVKTHADDSVINQNPGANGNRGQQNGQQNGGYNPQQQQKHMNTNLQALATTATGFFPDHQQPMHSGMPMSYPQHQNHNGSQQYYAPPQQSSYAYGNVSYALNHGGDVGNQASLETQKQGLENIRSLLLDAKAGIIDPTSYAQIGPRLATIGSSSLPFFSGQSMGDYQSGGGSPGGGVYGPTAQYSLPPVPNLRTKADLLDADQIFQAMQSTIYENPNAIAAAGAGQPGATYVQNLGHRQSHSPPGLHLPSGHNTSYASNLDAGSPHSHHSGTPALTPPSSAHSYNSGNSPPALRNHHEFGGPAPPAAMYPTLPGAPSDHTHGYGSTHMTTASALGSQLNNSHRRRYSGGTLQKAQPLHRGPKVEDAMDTSEDGASKAKENAVSGSSAEAGPTSKPQTRGTFSPSNIDPALGGVTSSPTGEMDEVAIKGNEMWLGTARTVEAIRAWIKHRLENDDHEGDEERSNPAEPKEERTSLYPVLASA